MSNYLKQCESEAKKRKTRHAYVISSVLKFVTIELIKLSRMMTALIDFQSVAFSPRRRQMDSKASLTTAGGFAIERTSTKYCLRIDFTAGGQHSVCQRLQVSTNPTPINKEFSFCFLFLVKLLYRVAQQQRQF